MNMNEDIPSNMLSSQVLLEFDVLDLVPVYHHLFPNKRNVLL